MDSVSSDTGIAQLFAMRYKDLYTSVPFDNHEMAKL